MFSVKRTTIYKITSAVMAFNMALMLPNISSAGTTPTTTNPIATTPSWAVANNCFGGPVHINIGMGGLGFNSSMGAIGGKPNTTFIEPPVPGPHDQPVSKNDWLSYLLPNGYTTQNANYKAELDSAPNPTDLYNNYLKYQAFWAAAKMMMNPGQGLFWCAPNGPSADFVTPNDDVTNSQITLNRILKNFPAMYKASQAGDYATLWSVAAQNNLVSLLETPLGSQVLGAKPFTKAQMEAYYSAASPYYVYSILGQNPYYPTLWGDPGKWIGNADVNITTSGDSQFPDFARFNGKQHEGGLFSKFLPYIEIVVAAVVSYFVGPEVEMAVDSEIAAAEGVAAVSTLTADAVAVGTSAVLNATVSAAFGGNFGSALVAGLEGGALTAGLGAADGLTGYSGAIVNGTIASTALNGGNVGKGLLSAAESAGALAGLTYASTGSFDLPTPTKSISTPPAANAGGVDLVSSAEPIVFDTPTIDPGPVPDMPAIAADDRAPASVPDAELAPTPDPIVSGPQFGAPLANGNSYDTISSVTNADGSITETLREPDGTLTTVTSPSTASYDSNSSEMPELTVVGTRIPMPTYNPSLNIGNFTKPTTYSAIYKGIGNRMVVQYGANLIRSVTYGHAILPRLLSPAVNLAKGIGGVVGGDTNAIGKSTFSLGVWAYEAGSTVAAGSFAAGRAIFGGPLGLAGTIGYGVGTVVYDNFLANNDTFNIAADSVFGGIGKFFTSIGNGNIFADIGQAQADMPQF